MKIATSESGMLDKG